MTPLRFSSLHLHQVGRGICTLLGHEHARHTSDTPRRAGGLMCRTASKAADMTSDVFVCAEPLVDTLGLLLAVVVTAANVDDHQRFMTLWETYLARGGRRLRKIWVDQGYEAQWLKEWAAGLKQTHKIDVEVVDAKARGSRSNSTAGKSNARFRGFAMIDATVGITKD
jgi:transposase